MSEIERRRFLQQAGWFGASFLGLQGCAEEVSSGPLGATGRVHAADGETWIYGYPAHATVVSGDSLRLHYLTNQPSFRLNLWRQGSHPSLVFTSDWFDSGAGLASAIGPMDASGNVVADSTAAVWTDWSWPYVDIAVDAAWPPGVYIVTLETPSSLADPGVAPPLYATSAQALIVLRPPAPTAAILYKLNLNTFHAYSDGPNSALAASFYDAQRVGSAPDGSGGTHEGYRVTLLRPGGGTGGDLLTIAPDPYDTTDESATPLNTFAHWDGHLIAWLEQSGIAVDFCTDTDLHEQPSLLGSYRLLMSGGHDEYWSAEMRDHVDAFVATGGNVAFLTGNTCYWHVYFADDNGDGHIDAMVCDKREPDGSYGGGDGADNWWKLRPENSTTGVSGRMGGWLYGPLDDTFGYTVQQTSEWMFAGTNLHDGASLGSAAKLIHYEFDAADYAVDATGVKRATTLDGTPASFVILGTCDLSGAGNLGVGTRESIFSGEPYSATMGYFARTGTVFNAATTEWPRALVVDPSVATITSNVVTGLSALRRVVALADIDGDGKEDLVFTAPFANGAAIGFWALDGGSVRSSGYVPRAQVAGWAPSAVADFDGDGNEDLLFYDGQSGQMAIWYLGHAASAVLGGQLVVAPLNAPGVPLAALDFNRDGRPDLLFWDQTTGQASIWLMDPESRTSFVGPVVIDQVAGPSLTLIGARDFNGDGVPDLVFFEASTGQVTVWLMGGPDGATRAGVQNVNRVADPGWGLVGVGDINGDGVPELIFQNPSNGQFVAWLLSGTSDLQFAQQIPLASAAASGPTCGPAFGGWVPQPAGGTLGGDTTTLAAMPDAQVGSFGRGTDGLIYFNVHSSAAPWQGWTVLSGLTVAQGDHVTVASYDDGRLVAFVRGSDGGIWFNVQSAADPRQWSGWSAIAGVTTSNGDALSAVCASDGRLAVIARQSSPAGTTSPHAINWETAPGSGVWAGWLAQPVGGTYAGDTSTLAPLANGLVMSFARGADGQVWTNLHSPTASWQGWYVLAGVSVGAGDGVSVTAHPAGHLIAAVRDSEGQVRINAQGPQFAAVWSGWMVASGLYVTTGDPIVILVDGSGDALLAVRGAGGLLSCNQQPSQGTWCGWSSVPGLEALPGDAFRATVAGDGKIVVANRATAPQGTPSPNAINWQT